MVRRLFLRVLQRIFIFLTVTLVIWFIVMQVFVRLDQRLPLFFALIVTYILSAYLLLPQVVRFSVMISRRGRIPRVTYTSDGLAADPVNILLSGTHEELTSAFKAAGWSQADRLNLKSSLKMIRCFVLNRPYLEAPFSGLYLFNRVQDYGFQQPIGSSPRKRHHVRFWAANIDPSHELSDVQYWMSLHPVSQKKSLTWIGAGTKDTGLGLSKLTYQISHSSDKDIDQERDYILDSLKKSGKIEAEHVINPGELVDGKYRSDGKIFWAHLKKS